MKIALFDMNHWDKNNVSRLLEDHELHMFDFSVQEEDFSSIQGAEAVCIFISSRMEPQDLDKFPNLKLICTMSTGYDHIDLEACSERGIKVCNVPYYGENTVAEHAFALVLAIARKLPEAIHRVRQNNFSVQGLEGFDLSGKTIGIIGAGHIGMHAIKIAKGFNMEVLVHDKVEQHHVGQVLQFSYVPLEELLEKSDVISVHIPYNKHTHHLLNKDNMQKMKKGCVFINTSRGGVIETKALLDAVQNHTIRAAGLDVVEGEELMGRQVGGEDVHKMEVLEQLIEMDNVLITPHSAFNTREALARIEETTAKNINKFSEGSLNNLVS